jgi:hypothetical protein
LLVFLWFLLILETRLVLALLAAMFPKPIDQTEIPFNASLAASLGLLTASLR